MIFRRYGTTYQSVDMDFDARALNEIAFRRNREQSIPAEEFEASYEVVSTVELSETAEGSVQSETEQAMLDRLGARVRELLDALADREVLVVENEQGHDYPKPRQLTKNVVVVGENRLHFAYSMHPPLRVSVRRGQG